MSIVKINTSTGEIVSNEMDDILSKLVNSNGDIDKQYFGVYKNTIKRELKIQLFRECLNLFV